MRFNSSGDFIFQIAYAVFVGLSLCKCMTDSDSVCVIVL